MAECTLSALIVDDSRDNRDIFRSILEGQDYAIQEAENGLEALAILDEATFDLMLLDLNMPKLGGDSVIEDVRRDPRHDDMTVVIVTAETYHTSDQHLNELATLVISKPIDVELFARLIQRLVPRMRKN